MLVEDFIDDLIKKNVFVEQVTLNTNGRFLCSEIVYPSREEIREFIKNGCIHSLNQTKLVYDTEGWPYDLRYCAICGIYLGKI